MIDRAQIGRSFGRHQFRIEEDVVRAFSESLGETDPIYTNLEAAKAAGLPSLAVPLSYFSSVSNAGLGSPNAWMEIVGVDLGRILHGSVRYRYEKPVYAGQTVIVEGKCADVRTSSRGDYQFVDRETRISDEQGDLLVVHTETVVVRPKPAAA